MKTITHRKRRAAKRRPKGFLGYERVNANGDVALVPTPNRPVGRYTYNAIMTPNEQNNSPKTPEEAKPPAENDKVVLVSTRDKTKQQIKDELYERCKKAGLIKE